MGPPFVVVDEISIQGRLHLVHGFEPGFPAFDTEMFIEQRPVKPLDDSVGLRPGNLGPLVLDALKLEEQLVGVLVRAPAKLPAIIAENGVDPGVVVLEGGQHVVIQGLDGGDGEFRGEQAAPGVAAVAVDHCLEIDLPHALQAAHHEGVHGDKGAGMGASIWRSLNSGENRSKARICSSVRSIFRSAVEFLQAQETFVFGQELMACSDAPDTAR